MPTTRPESALDGAPSSAPTRRRTLPPVGQKPAAPAAAPAGAPDPDIQLDIQLDNEDACSVPETQALEGRDDDPPGSHDPAAGDLNPGERIVVDAAWVAWAQQQLQQPLECQATHLEVGVPDTNTDEPDEDPFTADLLLAGSDPNGREIAVWLQLTPTIITDLQAHLDDVLAAQRRALGVTAPDDTDGTHHPDTAGDQPRAGGRARRIADPLAIRSLLQTSSTKAHATIAAAVIALVLLAVLVRAGSR